MAPLIRADGTEGKGSTMKRFLRTSAASTAALLLLATPAALAESGNDDVIRRGDCSGASDWKLKLSEEDGRLEVEFEVDQNVVGDTWKVRLTRNDVVFFTGQRTTQAPSGSFEVRRVISDPAGPDKVVGRAVNQRTGEVCRGTATSNF